MQMKTFCFLIKWLEINLESFNIRTVFRLQKEIRRKVFI